MGTWRRLLRVIAIPRSPTGGIVDPAHASLGRAVSHPLSSFEIEFRDGKAPIVGGYACVTTVISSLKLRLPISLVSQPVDPLSGATLTSC